MSLARTTSSRWKLKPLHLSEHPTPIEVSGPFTVGRDSSNDLCLTQPEVSSHHVGLEINGNELWVVDLGSTNGTLVNGSAVTRVELASGDTIQLGGGGPRLVALDAAAIRGATGSSGLATTKVVRAPRASTLPASAEAVRASGAKLATASARQPSAGAAAGGTTRAGASLPGSPLAIRKTLWVAVMLFTVGLMGAAAGLVYVERSSSAERVRLEGVSTQIQSRLERQLSDAGQRFDAQADFWERQRMGLEGERDTLLKQISSFERKGEDSRVALGQLREQLASTQQYLEMYDPVGLEQQRLEDVSQVRQAVVLIEKTVVYRDMRTGALLYFDRTEDDADALNLEGRGDPLTLDASTGSGFCIDADGWIITNAHVLEFAAQSFPVPFSDDVELRPERHLDVVFTDSDVRRSAVVARVSKRDDQDLALLKIEPFEGMPTLPSLDLDMSPPAPGSEVYLFGFPLGHHALQVGDTVIASTFKGILSRQVDPYLQVDAGVYPGNSGGPLTDAKGRVIGVIFSVQNNLDGTAAANIGYAIPVAGLASVLPPGGFLPGERILAPPIDAENSAAPFEGATAGPRR